VSCTLRAIGEGFDVEAFLRESPFSRATAFHKGEPRAAASGNGGQHGASGFTLPVSNASADDLAAQVDDATEFLRIHEEELRRLSQFPGLQEVCLDFAIRRRDGAVQIDVFPAELLWQAGALDIDLVVTHLALALDPGHVPPA
jgi:hypothetical protein